MTDVILPPSGQFLRDDVIRGGMDLMFFAHSRHLQHADEELATRGLGRAHHRAMYFLARKPDLSVGELLTILGITKQSFGRIAKSLTAQGLMVQRAGDRDRRQRLLSLTPEGLALEQAIFTQLHDNMARAYKASDSNAVAGFWIVLQHLMGDEAQGIFAKLHDSRAKAAGLSG